ncbi:FAD:protein FMN transferase [Candidatus Latescibacterota bacterium]
MIKKRFWGFGYAICIIIFGLILWRFVQGAPDKIQSQTRFLMDTFFTIQVPGDIEVLKDIEKAFVRIEEIDKKFNALNPQSPVYKFNNEDIPITDNEIVELVKKALEISIKSEGKYDITIFQLVELWGFFNKSPKVPSKEELDNALNIVSYNNIYIEKGELKKKKESTKIDLGSIAKGYALNEAKHILEQSGITSALIDGGGDIYALGAYNNQPWVIGIMNPRGEGVVGSLELEDMAVVTSGDYERIFEEEGKQYHHILDPSTGYPAEGLASVTVISPDPTSADAWATAFFVLGKEKTLELLKQLNSIEVFLITDEGENIYSKGMQVYNCACFDVNCYNEYYRTPFARTSLQLRFLQKRKLLKGCSLM